jgi:hypothetical protein
MHIIAPHFGLWGSVAQPAVDYLRGDKVADRIYTYSACLQHLRPFDQTVLVMGQARQQATHLLVRGC